MEEKFNNSVRAYKTKLGLLSEAQRRTLPLPEGFMEIPSSNGKRIKLEPTHRKQSDAMVTDTPATEHYTLHTVDNVYVTYPQSGRATVVHNDSLARLEEEVFFNDELVNIMIRLAHERCLTPLRKKKVRVCDSFMCAQLTRGADPTKTEISDAIKRNFARVAAYKTTTGFEGNEATIMPVEEGQHWYLLICFIEANNDNKRAHIAIADSWPGEPRRRMAKIVGEFMKFKFGDITVTFKELRVQKQENNYDCGLHVIENARRVLTYLGTCSHLNIGELETKMHVPPGVVSRADVRACLAALKEGKQAPTRMDIEEAGDKKEIKSDIMNIKTNSTPDTEAPSTMLTLLPNQEAHLIGKVIACNESAVVWNISPQTAQKIAEEATNKNTGQHKRVLVRIGEDNISIRRGTKIIRAIRIGLAKGPEI